MEDVQIYCGIDTKTGKLTGSSCRSDSPTYQGWALVEMSTPNVRIETMGVMQFVQKLNSDGFDVEKYISYLEEQA